MKAGIVGMGTVGRAAAAAMLQRGSCRELVLVNRRREVAEAVALDLRYGVPIGPAVTVRAGDYDDLRGAGVVVIAAGVNEKSGGATDRNDPEGRLKLIDANVPVMRAVVPPAVAAAPEAVLLVVPDPPDPLADLARQLAGHDRVVSSGTLSRQPALPHAPRRGAWASIRARCRPTCWASTAPAPWSTGRRSRSAGSRSRPCLSESASGSRRCGRGSRRRCAAPT